MMSSNEDKIRAELLQIWPDWQLMELIGHGAYGTVYKVRSKAMNHMEFQALKVISIPLDEDNSNGYTYGQIYDDQSKEKKKEYYRKMAVKLASEAKYMGNMKGNSNIVGYYDHAIIPHDAFDSTGNQMGFDIFIRMELLTPLNEHIAKHGFSRQELIKLGIDICKALEICRDHGVIHRDIKPENIFIAPNGNYKLGDFGVAINADKTIGGLSKKGTHAYMAPEVYMNPLDGYGQSVDIYSLGLVLYRLLNGGNGPFEDCNDLDGALARRMKGETLPFPKNDQTGLADIVRKASSYSKEDRYADPSEMRRDLEKFLSENDSQMLFVPSAFKDSTSVTNPVANSVNKIRGNINKPDDGVIEESFVSPKTKRGNKKIFAICGGIAAVICIAVFMFFLFRPSPESMEISVNAEYLVDGENYQVKTDLTPSHAHADINWTTSNSAIATIDEDGVLHAHTAGVVKVIATADNGIEASFDISVVSNFITEFNGIDYSLVYDFNYYVNAHDDVKNQFAGDPEGAIRYYVEVGMAQGQQAIVGFNPVYYANGYSDVRQIMGNDMEAYVRHYMEYGYAEGRNGLASETMLEYATVLNGVDYSPVYDYNYLISAFPAAYASCGVNDQAMLEYFVSDIMPRGIQGCQSFNPISYAFEYPDVRESCRSEIEGDLLEYYGSKESFDYSPYYYHYLNIGIEKGYHGVGCNEMKEYVTEYEGKDYSSVYDYNFYVDSYSDIFALLGVDDEAVLEHFVTLGQDEGRKGKG